MAKLALQITVYKIQSPQGSTVFDGGSTSSGTTQDVTIFYGGSELYVTRIPSRSGSASTYDSLITTGLNWRYFCVQEYADLVGTSGICATDVTNS